MAPQQHSHEWLATSNPRIVSCECKETIRIADLVRRTERDALERGKYDAFRQAMENHWLTPPARRLLSNFIREHHLTKEANAALPSQGSLL